MWKLLFLNQDINFCQEVSRLLSQDDKRLIIVHDAESAKQRLMGEQFHLVIIQDNLQEGQCRKILEMIMMIDETMPVILLLTQTALDDYRELVRPYTWNVLEKGFTTNTIINLIHSTIDHIKLHHKIRYLTHRQNYVFRFDNIVGVSAKFKEVLALVKKIAKSDSIVLIQGETGTGKELIAAALHYNSFRNQENFVAVNCAALNENLLESELFGHERGAYTGAHTLRIGRFEQANGGTLFLDEIGEMCLSVQAKVLRVLENQEFERLGSSKTIKVNVRVIAATNRDLEKEVREGRFRQDLFYRLSVIPITIPPLRERADDIIPLAMYFLNKYIGKGSGGSMVGFRPDCLEMLEGYTWPGNVRELENVIERAVLIANNEYITIEDLLIPKIHKEKAAVTLSESDNNNGHGVCISLPPGVMKLKVVERELIVLALKKAGGVQKGAAKLLGISSRVINYKIKKYKISQTKNPVSEGCDI